jgi:hypothetical protein
LREDLFRFIKSTHSLISPLFFLTETRFDTQSEYLSGTIIFASRSFLTSLLTMGNKIGLICLGFCLKGLTPGFRGILCSITMVSLVLISSYDQEKTSLYCLSRSSYLLFVLGGRYFDIFTIIGSSLVPMSQPSTSSSWGCKVDFKGISFWSNSLSKGISPFGI